MKKKAATAVAALQGASRGSTLGGIPVARRAAEGRSLDRGRGPRDTSSVDWPHAPLHRFSDAPAVYFITAATYLKQHFYRSADRLDALEAHVFDLATQFRCWLQAWAIFSNHYHLVVTVEAGGDSLRRMLSTLHKDEAREINRSDGVLGRKVWFQFRETQLTFERSWMARLRYTHENAVHHGIVTEAARYRWCSASWFEREARPSFAESLKRFKIDRVNVPDDFEVLAPE
jgi:putative transposase